jgi:hypothetical protein
MPLAEITDGTEVRDVVPNKHPPGSIGLTAAQEPTRGEGPRGLAVQEQGGQHRRVIRGLASFLRLRGLENRLAMQRGDNIQEEVDQVVRGQPIPRRGREQKGLVGIPRPELLAHERNRVRGRAGITSLDDGRLEIIRTRS